MLRGVLGWPSARRAQSPPDTRFATPTLSPMPKEAGQRRPESGGLFTGDQGHLPGLLPTPGVSRLTKGSARLRQVRPSAGRGQRERGLWGDPDWKEADVVPFHK